MDIAALLEKSMHDHDHLCPRQILGVRVGLAGLKVIGFQEPPTKKQVLAISETDGCFVNGVTAATGCSVGHRTLRVEDYGKVAVTFVDTRTGRAFRISPQLNVREQATKFVPEESRHYFAQLQAYQHMPDEDMLTIEEVILQTPVEQLMSKPGIRVNCSECGEEIINGREVICEGIVLCRTCYGVGYYQSSLSPCIAFSPNAAEQLQGM